MRIIGRAGFLFVFLFGLGVTGVQAKVTLVLNGPNPLTNYVGDTFTDPGARLVAPPKAITAGFDASYALKADSTVVGWGYDGHGQIDIPLGLSNVIALATSADSENCLALKSDRTVVQWGFNTSPVPDGLKQVADLTAGNYHNLALRANGTVVGWGYDEDSEDVADEVAGVRGVRAVAVGNYYSVALKRNGDVVGLGDGLAVLTNLPSRLTKVRKLVGAYDFMYALSTDGTVAAWGNNSSGQLNVPTNLTHVVQVTMGYGFGLALRADGTVVKWGWDDYLPDVSVPPGLSNVVQIAAGDYHCLALKRDGSIVGWGDDTYGQLDTPESVTNLSAQIEVSGAVMTNKPGKYFLEYSARTPSGSVVRATRQVIVLRSPANPAE